LVDVNETVFWVEETMCLAGGRGFKVGKHPIYRLGVLIPSPAKDKRIQSKNNSMVELPSGYLT
jgi:hypothetical protein